MNLKMDNGSKTIINILEQNGYEGYIVGGCVRDLIMGITPKDFDITTNCLPEKIMEVFSEYKVIPTGEEYGTITVVINHIPYEITTFRTEGNYLDNRHPSKIEFQSDLECDLSRRDFTINAMAYNEKKGLVDLFGGVEDIENGILRAVGDANSRFQEDALRIIRAYRFASRYNLTIEEKTIKAVYDDLPLLKAIAKERIFKELKEIFENNYDIFKLPFIQILIPELEACFKCEQNTKYHLYNVGEHIYHSFNNIKPVFHLKLAMLLHDIGKPYVKTVDDNGNDHFYTHANLSTEMARKILRRLNIDNKTRKKVTTLIQYHDTKFKCDKFHIKKMLNILSSDMFDDLMEVKIADERAKNSKYTKDNIPLIEKCIKLKQEIMEDKEVYSIKQLNISGNDLLKLGAKGEQIGIILDKLLEICMQNNKLNEKNYLMEKARDIIKKRR